MDFNIYRSMRTVAGYEVKSAFMRIIPLLDHDTPIPGNGARKRMTDNLKVKASKAVDDARVAAHAAYDDASVAAHNALKGAETDVKKASDDAKISVSKAVADAGIASHEAGSSMKKR
jgi:hypothetical protein